MSKAKKPNFDLVGAIVKRALTPTPKGAIKQVDRENRVKYVLEKYGMKDLSPANLLEYARRENISIDQIEKRIVRPLAEIKEEDENRFRKLTRNLQNSKLKSGEIWGIIVLVMFFLIWWTSK